MLLNGSRLTSKAVLAANFRYISRNSAIRKGQLWEKRVASRPPRRRPPPSLRSSEGTESHRNTRFQAGRVRIRDFPNRGDQFTSNLSDGAGLRRKSSTREEPENGKRRKERDERAMGRKDVSSSDTKSRGSVIETRRSSLRSRPTAVNDRGAEKEKRQEDHGRHRISRAFRPPSSEQTFERSRAGGTKDSGGRNDSRGAPPFSGRKLDDGWERGRRDEPPPSPFRLPFTTAASEFLYGHSSVTAALKSNRRWLQKLYIHPRANDELGSTSEIERLARNTKVSIRHVDDRWLPAMDKVAKDRPHNGLILEASPLPKPPVASLGTISLATRSIALNPVPHQSPEDVAINGSPNSIAFVSNERQPLVLFLDSILDPGNLGAIIRSAYFLGVDAVAISVRTCAPITPAAIKASAGAAEAMPILAVPGTADFLDGSLRNGWKVVAAVTPEEGGVSNRESARSFGLTIRRKIKGRNIQTTRFQDSNASSALRHPLIIAVGGEGTGLRGNIQKRAEYFVGIGPARDVDQVGVDSLNVSVAAALICQHFIAAPLYNVSREDDVKVKADLW